MNKVHQIEASQFARNLSEIVKDLYEHKQFSDVTLISEDYKQVHAHKFILSSSSSLFAKILVNLNHHQPIYLKGLQAKEMIFLLQYCYLGQVKIPYDCIEKFMTLLEDFDVWNCVSKKEEMHKTENNDGDDEAILKEENDDLRELKAEQRASTGQKVKKFKSNNNDSEPPKEDNIENIDYTEVEEELNECYPEVSKDKKVKGEQKKDSKNPRKKKEERSLTCDTCGYKATKYSSLTHHKKVIHLGIKNCFPCEICGKTLGGKAALVTHIKSIHDNYVYKCEVEYCNYSVKTKVALDRHTQYVHEGKEYFCDSCPKKFTKKIQLKKHFFLMHTDAPMLLCEKCDYKTKSKDSLKKHMAGHEGKKISCDKCDFKTIWKHNLYDHMRKVHKHPVIKCEFCQFTSISESAVKTHFNYTHFQTPVIKLKENLKI